MEDGSGGLSVADLVQRHATSRQNLSPVNPDAHARRETPAGGQPGQRRRPAEGQPGLNGRPGEATSGPQWPDHGTQHPDPPGRAMPPGEGTGRRALPDPPPARPTGHAMPEERHTGHHSLPEDPYGAPNSGFGPAGGPADNGLGAHRADHGGGFGPGDHFGTGPDDGFGPGGGVRRGGAGDSFGAPDGGFHRGGAAPGEGFGPEGGFGPAGGPPDNLGRNSENFGPTGPPDLPPGRPVAPGPGQGTGSYPIPGSAQSSGGRGLPPGQIAGRRALPDNGYDATPGDAFGPAGFGPSGGGLPDAYGPDFGPGAAGGGDFGPGAGPADFGPPPADNGFGPGQGTGQRPLPPNGFGPAAAHGSGPHQVMPPGQGSGPRPVPPPGQVTGGRPVVPGPGQSTGNRPMPGQSSGGRALPPGHATGPHEMPPGHATGAHGVPPGQATGRRPMPEDGFGPGQGSGHHPLPGPPPGHPSGPHPRPAPGHPSGPPPGEASRPGPGHPSGPLPGENSLPGESSLPPNGPGHAGPGEPPAIPSSRAGADERPAGRPNRPGEKAVPLPPPRQPEQDAISMTAEMEPIGEDVQKRRGIDHTLARFSAVHDEIQAEERERKAKRRKLMPWRQDDDEMDELDELVAGQTLSVRQPRPEARTDARPEQVPDERTEMVPESDGQTRLQEKKSRRRSRSTLAVRVFAATAAILVFVATGIAWGFKSWVDASSQQVDALDPNSDAIQDAAKQQGDENFLLVGSDTRAGAEAEDGVGDEKEVLGARSDTVMIAHIPANRDRAVVVSFPRDLEVRRPACEGWDPKSGDYTGEQKPAEDQVKLNTAYQLGGPKCVTKMVQQMSGLMINHFVGIDFNGFKGMVDAVNGVQMCVERPLKDDVLGTVVPKAGKNVTLTGDQALNFVRARHVQGDVTSDYGRIQRQQRFLSALLRKAMSTEVLLDPGKLTNFVEAFSKSTFGDNIGVDQMITLGQSLQGIEAGRVTFITVPTVGEANERGNEDLRVEDTKSLFRAIREDTPLPGESGGTQQVQSTLTAAPSGPVDPKTIKLQVFNGGNPTGGIAGDTADQLAEFGYEIVWVDAAPDNVKNTIIKYAKGREAQAQTLKSSVPDAELVEDPSLAGAIQLIIGPGFDGKVVAPGNGGGEPADELPSDLSTINGSDVSCV